MWFLLAVCRSSQPSGLSHCPTAHMQLSQACSRWCVESIHRVRDRNIFAQLRMVKNSSAGCAARHLKKQYKERFITLRTLSWESDQGALATASPVLATSTLYQLNRVLSANYCFHTVGKLLQSKAS